MMTMMMTLQVEIFLKFVVVVAVEVVDEEISREIKSRIVPIMELVQLESMKKNLGMKKREEDK
jgi:hypothetical protein